MEMREMVSFELGIEIQKDVFRLVTSVGQRKKLWVSMRNRMYSKDTFITYLVGVLTGENQMRIFSYLCWLENSKVSIFCINTWKLKRIKSTSKTFPFCSRSMSHSHVLTFDFFSHIITHTLITENPHFTFSILHNKFS